MINRQPERIANKFNRTEHNFCVGVKHNMGSFIPHLQFINDEVNKFYEDLVKPIIDKYNNGYRYSVFIKNKEYLIKNIFIGIIILTIK